MYVVSPVFDAVPSFMEYSTSRIVWACDKNHDVSCMRMRLHEIYGVHSFYTAGKSATQCPKSL